MWFEQLFLKIHLFQVQKVVIFRHFVWVLFLKSCSMNFDTLFVRTYCDTCIVVCNVFARCYFIFNVINTILINIVYTWRFFNLVNLNDDLQIYLFINIDLLNKNLNIKQFYGKWTSCVWSDSIDVLFLWLSMKLRNLWILIWPYISDQF